jgi:RNA polymerase sigma-70 factor (ECF subfamily)
MLDADSFAALFNKAHQRLWLIAAGITGDRTLAEDVVQDAAVVALRSLDRFQPGTSFTAWMSEIVRLRALNYARTAKLRHTVPTDPHFVDQICSAQEFTSEPPLSASAGGTLPELQTLFDDHVMHALEQLGAVPRACLLLRIVHQLSYAEIADTMRIPQGTAMSHVHRAKRTLREHLAGDPQKNIGHGEPSR